jgi:predicted phosphodiesterase
VRILLASDLHYSLPQFDWVLDRAARHDTVVLAGDVLDLSSAVPLESQIVVVQRWPSTGPTS